MTEYKEIGIEDVLEISPTLTANQILLIKGVEFGTDEKKRKYAVIFDGVTGKKFHTYSEYVIQRLEALKSKKIDFTKTPVKCMLKINESDVGNSYMQLVAAK